MSEEVKLKFRYDQDSKRFHRYRLVDPEGYVTGSIYFSKDMEELPSKLVLEREDRK